MQDDLRRILATFPGVNFAIRGFLAERIEETLTGSTAELVVQGVRRRSRQPRRRGPAGGARRCARSPGAADVQYDPPPVAPEVTVRLRPATWPRAGLARRRRCSRAVETATRGVEGGPDLRGQPRHRRRGDPPCRSAARSPRTLAACRSSRPGGRMVGLSPGGRRSPHHRPLSDRTSGRAAGPDGDGERPRWRRRPASRDAAAALGREHGAFPRASTPRSGAPPPRSGRLSASCCCDGLLAGAGIVMLLWRRVRRVEPAAAGAGQPAVRAGGRGARGVRDRRAV